MDLFLGRIVVFSFQRLTFIIDQLLQVVESPCDSAITSDGPALSAYQYFENVRNFLVAVQELGIPLFEASDLEQVSFKGI